MSWDFCTVQAQELRASLLDYLMGIACTEGMRQKLEHLSSHLVPTMVSNYLLLDENNILLTT